MGKEFFAGIYMAAAAVLAIYFYRAILQKDELGKRMARVLCVSLVVVLSYVLYLCTNQYLLMSITQSIVFAGIDWILLTLFHFCVLFTEESLPTKGLHKVLVAVAIVDNVHLLLNPFLNLSIDYKMVSIDKYNYLIYQPKLLFHIHLVFCYIMVVGIMFTLIKKCICVAKLYRIRYLFFAFSFLAVILGNVVFLVIGGNIDYTIMIYAVLGCFLYFYVFDYKGTSAANAAKAFFVEEMNNPIIIFDYQGKMLMCNKRARELFGVDQNSTQKSFEQKQSYLIQDKEEEQTLETTIVHKDRVFYFQIQYKYLKDKKNRTIGTIFVYDDITEKKRALIQTEYNATHDMLTGVYNRNFMTTFKQVAQDEQQCPIYGAIYNINGMRYINETFGTATGDKALCRMAWIIQQFSRTSDYVIRTDGGEMLLLVLGNSEKKANEIFRKIERRILSFTVEDVEVSAEFSYFQLDDIEQFDKTYEKARREIAQKKKTKASPQVIRM